MNWKQLFSLEERRVSSLIIAMIVTLLYCLVIYWIKNDISSNLVDILESLIFGVVGVSATSTIQNFIEYKDKNNQLKQLDNINNENNNGSENI